MNTASDASATASVLSRIRNGVVGTWLVVVCYGGVFYIVLCAIAAYQVQRAAEELVSATELPGETARACLPDDRRGVAGEQAEGCAGADLIANALRLNAARGSIEDLSRLYDELSTRRDSLAQLSDSLLTLVFESRFDPYPYWVELDPLVEQAGEASGSLRDPQDYSQIRDIVVVGLQDDDDRRRFDSVLVAFEAEYEADTAYASARASYDSVDPHWEGVRDSLREAQQGRTAAYNSEKELARRFSITSAERIGAEIRGLRIFAPLVRTRESVLVFLLAIAMGALGSTIHITRTFLAGESRPMAWYLIRPLLGTVTAVAIYILAKAGQLALNPGAATGAMDPWFISFLAIISGLMSDDAVRRLSDAGARVFKTPSHDQPDRWGLNLGQRMAESVTDRAPLAAALGVSASKLDSWTNATEPVPSYAQGMIAAWLRQPVRELFSDMEPTRLPSASPPSSPPLTAPASGEEPPSSQPVGPQVEAGEDDDETS